jgi:hypothetical protein
MITCTKKEREWFLQNIAQGLVDYLGVMEPPVPIEKLLRNPPAIYDADFGVVEMNSELWDATFARLPDQSGKIFVHSDLGPEARRYALARETLSALITSKHGQNLGLFELVESHLRESAEFFARILLAPPRLLRCFCSGDGAVTRIVKEFKLPMHAASKLCEDMSTA